jgi:hypothetical protein
MFNLTSAASCCVPWFIRLFRRVFGVNIYTALFLDDKAFIHNFTAQKIRLDLNTYIMTFKMREILMFKKSFDLLVYLLVYVRALYQLYLLYEVE